MRGLIVLLALLSAPFVTAGAQSYPAQSQRCKHTTFTHHDADDAGGHSQDPDAQDDQHPFTHHDAQDADGHAQDPDAQDNRHPTVTHHDADDAGGHSEDPDGQDKKCTPAPPAPPSCGPTGALGGAASIAGQVISATTNAGEPGWCIQAFVNGAAVLGAATDASGNYTLTGLVGDTTTYLVCEAPKTGATQTFPAGVPLPSCPSGALGYSFQLNTGNASFVDFWDNP
jgi:hypothetical protein